MNNIFVISINSQKDIELTEGLIDQIAKQLGRTLVEEVINECPIDPQELRINVHSYNEEDIHKMLIDQLHRITERPTNKKTATKSDLELMCEEFITRYACSSPRVFPTLPNATKLKCIIEYVNAHNTVLKKGNLYTKVKNITPQNTEKWNLLLKYGLELLPKCINLASLSQ